MTLNKRSYNSEEIYSLLHQSTHSTHKGITVATLARILQPIPQANCLS